MRPSHREGANSRMVENTHLGGVGSSAKRHTAATHGRSVGPTVCINQAMLKSLRAERRNRLPMCLFPYGRSLRTV